MEEKLVSVIQFLDTPKIKRQPGKYVFYEHEEKYLEEIKKGDTFNYVVQREASVEKQGLVEIYPNYCIELNEVFSTVRATISTYVRRKTVNDITYDEMESVEGARFMVQVVVDI